MKKRISFKVVLLIIFIFFNGCSGLKINQISFKDSNANFIQNNIEKININELIKYLNKNEKIILVSLENEETTDNPIISIIEDVLIEKFTKKGFTVLERDKDLLTHLMSESDSSYVDYLKTKDPTFANKLKTADKIVAYRVLECGIVYEEINSNPATSDSLYRSATTILKFRIENARTGEILAIKNLESSLTDKISKKDKALLEDFHYKHYRFGYPVKFGNSKQIINKSNSKVNTGSFLNSKKLLLGTISTLAVLVLLFAI